MSRNDTLIRYLNEAQATERALVTTLTAHLSMAPPGPYRELLERHLGETRRHARAVGERLDELGYSDSLIHLTVNLAETIVGQTLSLAKGPLDLLRGQDREEKLLKNAKDECATEALEIATYEAIQTLARQLGDSETAQLAVSHRADEERMLAALRELLPDLTRAAVAARTGGKGEFRLSDTAAAEAVRDSRPLQAAQRGG
jgi:ferritin-like metal-binding protein YciE